MSCCQTTQDGMFFVFGICFLVLFGCLQCSCWQSGIFARCKNCSGDAHPASIYCALPTALHLTLRCTCALPCTCAPCTHLPCTYLPCPATTHLPCSASTCPPLHPGTAHTGPALPLPICPAPPYLPALHPLTCHVPDCPAPTCPAPHLPALLLPNPP